MTAEGHPSSLTICWINPYIVSVAEGPRGVETVGEDSQVNDDSCNHNNNHDHNHDGNGNRNHKNQVIMPWTTSSRGPRFQRSTSTRAKSLSVSSRCECVYVFVCVHLVETSVTTTVTMSNLLHSFFRQTTTAPFARSFSFSHMPTAKRLVQRKKYPTLTYLPWV